MPLDIPRFYQTGYVVDDLEEATERWRRTTGAGPFQWLKDIQVENGLYRGAPTDVLFSVALAQCGDLQIELIAQHNDAPSCYRDLFAPGQEGLHHLAVRTDSFEAELSGYEAAGFPAAFSGTYRGTRFAYVDTSPALGFMLELVETR
jgi:hypothetical protein